MSDMSRVLRDALVANIRGIERCADQCVNLAEDAKLSGSPEMSRVLLHLARTHRVQVLELRGRLAALAARRPDLASDAADRERSPD